MENLNTEVSANAIDSGIDLMQILTEQIKIVSAFYGDNPKDQLPNLCLAVISQDDQRMTLAPWANDEEREEIIQVLRHGLNSMNAVAYCFTSESWVVKTSNPDLSIRPADNPNRIEAVMFTVATKTDALTAFLEIERDADGSVICLTEKQPVRRTLAGKAGRMSSLLLDDDTHSIFDFSKGSPPNGTLTLH